MVDISSKVIMVGMSKKRKFGSPASKRIGNEEEECGASQVIREDGSRKETERQVDSRDTLGTGTPGNDTDKHRRRAGAGVRLSPSTKDKICDDMTNEERRGFVTRSGRMYNRTEMGTGRE